MHTLCFRARARDDDAWIRRVMLKWLMVNMRKELRKNMCMQCCDEVSFLSISFIVTAVATATATATISAAINVPCILYACVSIIITAIIIKSPASIVFTFSLGHRNNQPSHLYRILQIPSVLRSRAIH